MAREKIIQDLMVHFNEWPKDDSNRNRKGGIGEMLKIKNLHCTISSN